MDAVATLTGHADRVWACAWNGDALIASASGDKKVRLWENKDGTWVCRQTLDQHHRTVRHVAWSRDGKLLACSSFDSSVSLWADGGSSDFICVGLLEGHHDNEIKAVSFSPSGLIATCGRDKMVWLWEEESRTEESLEYEGIACLAEHTQDVKYVQWHPTRDTLYSTSYDASIKVWEADPSQPDMWNCVQTVTAESGGHTETVWQIAFSSQGDTAASCSDDCNVIVWNCVDGRLQRACIISGLHRRTIYSLDFRPDSNELVTASGDDAVRVFTKNRADTTAPGTHSGYACSCEIAAAHDSDVNCVRFSPSGNLLASCADDFTLKLWRPRP